MSGRVGLELADTRSIRRDLVALGVQHRPGFVAIDEHPTFIERLEKKQR
ncbi:MAG: hypothetical protein ACR2MA_13475 [Egibacteraceae bacterium]